MGTTKAIAGLTAFVVGLILCSRGAGDEQMRSGNGEEIKQRLNSASEQVRRDAHRTIRNDQHLVISHLIAVLEDESPSAEPSRRRAWDRQREAIELLADLRSERSCQAIAKHLFSLPGQPFVSIDDPFVEYPAARALVQIGGPSAHAAFRGQLGDELDAGELRVLTWIVFEWDGRDVGEARLKSWAQDAERAAAAGKSRREEMRLENIKSLLYLIQTIDFTSNEHFPKRTK